MSLARGPRARDVEAVEAHQEFVLVPYSVQVPHGVGGDDDVSLLALEALDGVQGAPYQDGIVVGKELLQPTDYEPPLHSMRGHDADCICPERLRGVRHLARWPGLAGVGVSLA